jgi:hypothetical protein
VNLSFEAADSAKRRSFWKGPRSFDIHFFVSFLLSPPKASNACRPRVARLPASWAGNNENEMEIENKNKKYLKLTNLN